MVASAHAEAKSASVGTSRGGILRPFHLRQSLHLSREEIEDEIRSRVHTVSLGDGIVLARVLGRFKMYLSADDVGFAANVMLDGYWESWLTRFLAALAQPGMVVVDVGANFGYHSLTLADACGPTGHLFAVEPNPAALTLLRRTIALNGMAPFTTILPVALGREAEATVGLIVPEGEPKNAHVVPPSPDRLTVTSTSLDAVFAGGRRVDLIKIDVEGAERAIVAGGAAILARDRPHLILEYNAARYEEPRALLEELMAIYGGLRRIDFEGVAEEAEPASVYGDISGEDQLLYFAR